MIPVDPRPKREVSPTSTEVEEQQELTNIFLENGQSISQAEKNASDAVRKYLSYAEDNGEPVWRGLFGGTARGIAGRGQLAAQILERDRFAGLPNMLEAARVQLRARGWNDTEIDSVARNRLHRDDSGMAVYDGRVAGEGGWTEDALIRLAVGQIHAELTQHRQAEPNPEADAAHRKHAARHGLNYRL